LHIGKKASGALNVETTEIPIFCGGKCTNHKELNKEKVVDASL